MIGTVYISGPMAGYPNMNEPAFRAAENTIWDAGAEPLTPHDILPHEHIGACPTVYGNGSPKDHDSGCYLRGDLVAMLDKADSLYVLPGWSRSRGAQIEVLIARLLRIPIEYHPDAVTAMSEQITTAAELDALPVCTILADNGGHPVWRDRVQGWCASNGTRGIDTDIVIRDGAPLTVLYRPDAPFS